MRISTTWTVRSRVARGGGRDGCDRRDERRRGGVCMLVGWRGVRGGRGRCGSLGLGRGWVGVRVGDGMIRNLDWKHFCKIKK